MQMPKLRILRKITKVVKGEKKKTSPQLGLVIFAKLAAFACKPGHISTGDITETVILISGHESAPDWPLSCPNYILL